MKYVKTFEELWFKKESEKDLNRKKLVSVCKYILEQFKGKTIIGLKLLRVEVGFSKSKEDRFIIQLFLDGGDLIRFNWVVNENYLVESFESFYTIKDGKTNLHSIKQKMDRANIDDYLELNNIVNLVSNFFKDQKIMK
jgi:hypothetical protein